MHLKPRLSLPYNACRRELHAVIFRAQLFFDVRKHRRCVYCVTGDTMGMYPVRVQHCEITCACLYQILQRFTDVSQDIAALHLWWYCVMVSVDLGG